MNKPVAFLTGLGLGGGLMFMLDPERGRRRRAVVRDKAVGAWNDTGRAVRKTSRHLTNRAQGVVWSATSMLHRGEVDAGKLEGRIRSRIGRAVSHSGAIEVRVTENRAMVSGPVLASEAEELLSTIRGVPGVKEVENRLDVHQSADIPALQGGGRGQEQNWSPAWRTVAGVSGGALAVYGLAVRRGKLGRMAGAAGLSLLARGTTNRGVRKLLGLARRAA
jgi:hypothetical protein